MIKNQMEKIYEKYYKELYLYAFSLCKDYHLAQDLTSETFFKAYISLGDVDYIKYWLFRVCKNLYFDFLKKDREHASGEILEKTLTSNEDPLDRLIETEERKYIYNLILSLSESYKEMLILYYYCDFSLREISNIRDTSEGAAKTMLFRARMKLKKELEG